MFLEKCGRLFFLQMRPIFFFACILFPLLGSGFFLSQKSLSLEELKIRFANAVRKEKTALERKNQKERFLQRYSQASPYFLNENIESFQLLKKEREKLESLQNHPAFPESQTLQDRILFLNENRLIFTEQKLDISSLIKETEEKLRHPVQVDEDDLKQLLCLIEDIQVDSYLPILGSPQILIKEFLLRKCETSLHTEAFEIEMDLLKREFISP